MHTRQSERGAVSLFIVIFTTLLVTVVTVSFVRVMMSEQEQATTADLSQSAYDSAQAGVEDAKRALLFYESECASGDVGRCTAATNAIHATECNAALQDVVTYKVGEEVVVKQNAGDVDLQQAYTCVKLDLQTLDYQGTLAQDEGKLVPLRGVSSFDTVTIEWFSAKDLKNGTNTVNVPAFSAGTPLLTQAAWNASATPNRPSIIRSQLIQFGDTGFTLNDFSGDTNTGNTSNANTLFLYPSNVIDSTKTFASNARKTATSKPVLTTCKAALTSGGYACSATILLPDPIGGGNRQAYLQLNSLYKKSSYRVSLSSGGASVDFDAVQPEVDSTGRANDLFRRIQSRIESFDGVYPEATIDVTGSFCKNFIITGKESDYADYATSAGCTP